MILSLRMRQVRHGRSVFDILVPQTLRIGEREALPQEVENTTGNQLIVHVWTPEGSAKQQTLPRPVINRYIAAVDADGVISTGHAALELPPTLYISLYPAAEIDRSPSEFFNLLKAVEANTVAGKYQPDYPFEANMWCESDRKIHFSTFNATSLTSFWNHYRQTKTYNLIWRNCSSSVAWALEAAMDGALKERCTRGGFVRLLFIPELWIAAQLRKRATNMAWTPGLVLDYTRALHAVVHPTEVSLIHLIKKRWFTAADSED